MPVKHERLQARAENAAELLLHRSNRVGDGHGSYCTVH
jgi:hypothetical protein